MTVYVGTSGWQYRDWRDRFYPNGLAASRWLPYYAERFRTVEVNASFYRLPTRETVERWAATVPSGFVLTMKASRFITHIRRLRDCAEPLERMREVFGGAGEKLGPVLFQLPPNFEADEERLREFLELLPAEMRLPAFEFRHRSWFRPSVFAALEARGAALVHADRPGVRVDVPTIAGWSYLRFHQGGPATPGYRRSKVRAYADAIATAGARTLFAYFNNDTGGAAPRDADTLVGLLAERRVELAA